MFCTKCKKGDTRVVDSRNDSKTVRRRRECLKCGFRFTTYERSEGPNFRVKKRNRNLEPFDRDKVYQGIIKAFEKRPYKKEEIELIVDSVEEKLASMQKNIIESIKIGELVSKELKQFDEVAYLRFISVYKSFSSAKSFENEAKKLVLGKSKK